jgi:hypothetical protein
LASVFFSYSHKEEDLRDRLETHLSALKREGIIEAWHDRRIIAGDDLGSKISHELERADIILLLVSPDFIASDYCYNIEMQRALERHEAGEARVIPIILRHCDWTSTPLGKLLAAPKDGKPIVTWPDLDEGFLDIVKKIRAALPKESPQTAQTGLSEGIRQVSRLSAAPALSPRSSNLRLKKTFTEIDRDRFLDDAFEYMARFFEGSMEELKARNPGVETTFRRIDANHFTGIIYQGGKAASRCKVTLGGMFGRGITYSDNDQARDNSMNESLSVESDDQGLYLKAMGMAHWGQDRDRHLTFEGASEYYWDMFIRPVQER